MNLYTQGTFDLFHNGHARFLTRCKDLVGEDGRVVVSLLDDDVVEKYRGKAPILTYEERYEILESLRCVDEVICGDNTSTESEITWIEADIIAIGTDWASKDLAKQYLMDKLYLDSFLIYIPYTESISSTKIKERIKSHG